jgi:DNA transposition AAA+ family ATPase
MKQSNVFSLPADNGSVVVNVKDRSSKYSKIKKTIDAVQKISNRKFDCILEELSRATKYPLGEIRKWFNGQSIANRDDFENKTNNYLERILNIYADKNQTSLITSKETEVFKICSGAFDLLSESNRIGSIKGGAGFGKTTVAKFYARENDCLYLQMNRGDTSINAVLNKIEDALNLSTSSKIYSHRIDSIRRAIKSDGYRNPFIIHEEYRPGRMIIADQSDYLSPDGIDILRTLSEGANVGLCFLGLPRFDKKLNTNRPEILQLRDRISVSINLEPPTYEDVCEVLDLNWPGLTDELKREFYKYSRKTYRLLAHLIFHSRRILFSEQNFGSEISVDVVREASGLLPQYSDEE